MKQKLILIDGSSLLSTSFFAVGFPNQFFKIKDAEEKQKLLNEKLMKTSDGRFTNAVLGFSRSFLKIIEKQNPTHIAVAWDVNRSSLERKEIYSEYKGHREETLPQLGQQFGTMQKLLKEANVPQFQLERHEADDIIGTFAKRFEKEMPTYILTKDQDALQLVSEQTRVWLTTKSCKEMYESRGIDIKQLNIPEGVFEFTPITFEEEYGLKPIQMIDKKAIEGDSSDNIPGVKNVGSASAIPLIKEYGTLENIYEVIENEPEKELKEFFKTNLGIKRSPIKNLVEQKEIAFLSKKLATVKTDLEPFNSMDLRELELSLDKGKMRAAFEDLQFKSLL